MKYVYGFNEGNKGMKSVLGGKGANLAEMTNLGISVPNGFIISTDACKDYLIEKSLNNDLVEQIIEFIKNIENLTSKSFGKEGNTLLFSVRSGAPVSMPGMMDTILNLGLNDHTVVNFANEISNERVAYDCYRRLISMYGNVVKEIPSRYFEHEITVLKEARNIALDSDLTAEDFKLLVEKFKEVYASHTNESFPQNVGTQLLSSVEAVFKSWNNDRAITYREINGIDGNIGTAVVVQMMVFGNYNDISGTGVVFSSNPNDGSKELYGEYLLNAQGEDIVAGIRTPEHVSLLETKLPEVYNELLTTANYLEDYFQDMQDIEFTVENGKLYILQTRNGQRSVKAKVQLMLNRYNANKMSKEEFVDKITVEDVETYLFSKFDEDKIKEDDVFATGLPASAGVASGIICFDEAAVVETVKKDKVAILVRNETSADDIKAMHLSSAVVTSLGGMTSHAAVVARGMGVCCVCGISSMSVNEKDKEVTCNGVTLREFDEISVDGSSGTVYIGSIAVKEAELDDNFYRIMEILDEVKDIAVYANADEGNTCFDAYKYGAEGIGLVRTEHMFFDEKRLIEMQALIMSNTLEERVEFLKKMAEFQIEDFKKILEVSNNKPVTIRLLDPPLHEFLPRKLSQAKELATKLGISVETVKTRIKSLKEENPMLGHRGCRLAITYPEIYQMQVESIVSAVVTLKNQGLNPVAKIMIPLVSEENEIVYLKRVIDSTISRLLNGQDIDINISFGVMIETPRAALISDHIAKYVDFFSYGTNDLTQTTYGLSRDDAARFLPSYYEKNIIKNDPFVTIDKLGVGKLIILSNQFGKIANESLISGICGEHGGEFESVQFAYNIGLDYVSCSPKRIPLTKLAAAKAAIQVNKNE